MLHPGLLWAGKPASKQLQVRGFAALGLFRPYSVPRPGLLMQGWRHCLA